MRLLLNVIWFVLCGLWLAIFYTIAGVLACILIVTIPFGLAAFRIAAFSLWPFGRALQQRPTAGAWSLIGNVVWIVLFGWELALVHLVAGALLCLTIVGIPLGIAAFRLIPVALVPLGTRIVDSDSYLPTRV